MTGPGARILREAPRACRIFLRENYENSEKTPGGCRLPAGYPCLSAACPPQLAAKKYC